MVQHGNRSKSDKMDINTVPEVDFQSLLQETIDNLRKDDATDVALLDILTEHIITLSPARNSVDLAFKNIVSLAAQRGAK